MKNDRIEKLKAEIEQIKAQTNFEIGKRQGQIELLEELEKKDVKTKNNQ